MPNWSPEQRANARVIIEVGQEMRMSDRDIVIALMTAMQESGLRNLKYGSSDSVGLFQQRPSQGWGTVQQVTNPLYASRKFFGALRSVKNRNNMSLAAAAQTVQKSAFPMAYAKWENAGRSLMNDMGYKGGLPFPLQRPQMDLDDDGLLDDSQPFDPMGLVQGTGTETPMESDIAPVATGVGDATKGVVLPARKVPVDRELTPGQDDGFPALTALAGGGARERMIEAAMKYIGLPYVWGGGHGAKPGVSKGGLDCSGLVRIALAAGGVTTAQMVAAQQMRLGKQTSIDKLQPGDLVARPSGSHIALYIGNGKMIEAPYTGAKVRITPVRSGMVGIALSLAGAKEYPADYADDNGSTQPQSYEPETLFSFPGLV